MEIEVGPALAPDATPGVSRASLERLDHAVERAHDHIETAMAAGEHGYAALDLGDRTDHRAIEAAVADLPTDGPVLVVGMGGSALGARAIAAALAPERPWHVLDTIDPEYLERVLGSVDLEGTAVHVVSRSGTTVETRATFRVVAEAMAAAGVDWRERTVATTAADGPLGHRLADEGVPVLEPPAGVPGRYSVLSSMALPSASLLGVDVDGLLAGARSARGTLAPSLFDSPAYAYGAVTAALATRGAAQNVFLPYDEGLHGVARWARQLWAESLGKDGLGQAPIAGRGVADHHSQLQRWRDGPRDTLLTVVTGGSADGPAVPAAGDDLDGVALGELVGLERRALEASLSRDGRPWVRLEPGPLDASALGGLFLDLEAACILHAELLRVDPFDQPAVEWGKRAVRETLAGETTDRTRALSADDILRIPR